MKGKCVLSRNCSAYNRLVNSVNVTNEKVAFLRMIHCKIDQNDDVYVCCPKTGYSYRNPTIQIVGPKIRRRPVKMANRFEYEDEDENFLNTCGQSASEDRIFGGQLTAIDEFPWLAVLFYSKSEFNIMR